VIQNTEIQKLLYRARLQLEEGQYEAALSSLHVLPVEDEKQQREVAYLSGWCYIQGKQWAEAKKVLSPFLERQSKLLEEEPFLEQPGEILEKEPLLEREHLVLSWLHLGIAAVNLSHYEDASLHFSRCLKILHDRRVHLPVVRIKARYSLAMTCLMKGSYSMAIQHYEDALRLCRLSHVEEEVPHIYYGLCNAYRGIGDYVKAMVAGQEALQRYQQREDRPLEARMHHELGRVSFLLCDYRAASDYYTESLALATSYNSPTMIMLNCAMLADLRLAEQRLPEARRYCRLALEMMERVTSAHMKGKTYYAIGKVSYAEARESGGEQRQHLLRETMDWFQRAKTQLEQTQAYADMAEMYGMWGQVLEDAGNMEEAIVLWRQGYEILSERKDNTR
jgi:tetratricopeptide (TPR) repeat protein